MDTKTEIEVSNLKHNIKLLIKQIVILEILVGEIEDNETNIRNEIKVSAMSQATVLASSDLTSSIERTLFEYRKTLDYSQDRVKSLKRFDREERFPSIVKKAQKKSLESFEAQKATLSSSKSKKTLLELAISENQAKRDNELSSISFSPTNQENAFKVFCGRDYLGTIKRARVKYQSGSAKVFTEEALTTRRFVKDGELQVTDKPLFSNSRFTAWRVARIEESFRTYQDAVKALIEKKGV